MNKNYNVLIVHNYYKQPGGEGIVVENEKTMLESHGHNVFLYTRNNNEISEYSLLQKILLPFSYLFNMKTYSDIKRIIKENNIDIVHVHNTINIISPSVYYAAFKLNKPVVKTIHNFRLLCPNGLFYRSEKVCEDCVNRGLRCAIKHSCYRNSKAETILAVMNMKIQRILGLYGKLNYICLTEFNKQKLLQLKQIDKKRVYIKPNFSFRGSNSIVLKRKDQIVFASRLDEYKGIKFLFETWKTMGKEAPKLLVFGSGELEQWCKDFIKDNDIDNIIMNGFVENEVVRQVMKESIGTIVCSELYESFSMDVVESFSVGTPVIVNDIGNPQYLVSNGVNGFIFNKGSIDSCIDAIDKLKNTVNINENTYKRYIEQYSEDVNYKQLVDIYASIINR